ncbi:MAG: DinB family protein [Brumimicrobium sp.]
MKTFNTNQLLDDLKQITENNITLITKKFSHLSDEQKKWRPTSDSWNILEVFSHLNVYAKFYHTTFIDKIQKTKFKVAKDTFVSSPLGRSAWKSMKLGRANNVKRKFKAPKNYNPSNDESLISNDAISEFSENQKQLLDILEMAKQVNLRKVKIPISISKIVRLRLGDALMFVIYHDERHVQQALNILTHPKFPKKK